MAPKVGAHKTSMLQDIETGRPTEADAIVGAVAELEGYHPNFLILMRSMPALLENGLAKVLPEGEHFFCLAENDVVH